MIRAVHFADASSIFDVLQRARAESSVPIGPNWTLSQITEECRGVGYVFEKSAELKAFILFRDTGAAWEITFLATDPDAQGQGFMKALIERMRADRPLERPIWLEVHSENVKARRLYEQQGFEVVGERPKYYADGGSAILYSFGAETPAEA
jgi:ribosomal protein S18 acetylase RimI-like enzyme